MVTETADCLSTGNKHRQLLLSKSASEAVSALVGAEDADRDLGCYVKWVRQEMDGKPSGYGSQIDV